MEAWAPLFDIFLNSPCPETEASLWMHNSFNDASKATTITNTNSLLLLLSNPIDVAVIRTCDSSSSQPKRVMWIQTLPNAVQSRILSFLSVERRRFCGRDLCVHASNILRGSEKEDFWVKKAARNLLDEMPSTSSDFFFFGLNLGQSDGQMEEFEKLPGWLESATEASNSLFPWLPICRNELCERTLASDVFEEEEEEGFFIIDDEDLSQVVAETETEIDCVEDGYVAPEIQSAAAGLKARILTFESTSRTSELANEMLQL